MKLDCIRREMDSLEALGIPEFSLCVMKDHQTLYFDRRGTYKEGARYFLFSCTKPMIAAAALSLCERGLMDLDDPVRQYLPAFADTYLIKDGKRVLTENRMLIRHLLTMSAGLNYTLDTPEIVRASRQPGADTQSVVSAFALSPLEFEPGEMYRYSLCLDTLGAVMESAAGKPLDLLMKEVLFDPLGMEHTGFCFDPAEIAKKYTYQNGAFCPEDTPARNVYILSPAYLSGGAGLVSTLEDLALFADAMACGGIGVKGQRALKPATVRMMREDHMKGFLRQNNFSCAAGDEFSYGLGVHTLVNRHADTRAPYGVFGWDGAAGAYVMSDAENGISIAYMMHVHCWPSIRPLFHRPLREAVYEALGFEPGGN